ncbi:hypothetical protein GWK47_012010 [Chionoecetes opilio]|uniref:Uncharacterized protein n=1 Tax=Chionoecetes opilio TaxID=41210 RepID=A0A8J4XV48_CHIOP|nr:hypothetical protein GWK47_012010 [Chionoecetes opilio]
MLKMIKEQAVVRNVTTRDGIILAWLVDKERPVAITTPEELHKVGIDSPDWKRLKLDHLTVLEFSCLVRQACKESNEVNEASCVRPGRWKNERKSEYVESVDGNRVNELHDGVDDMTVDDITHQLKLVLIEPALKTFSQTNDLRTWYGTGEVPNNRIPGESPSVERRGSPGVFSTTRSRRRFFSLQQLSTAEKVLEVWRRANIPTSDVSWVKKKVLQTVRGVGRLAKSKHGRRDGKKKIEEMHFQRPLEDFFDMRFSKGQGKRRPPKTRLFLEVRGGTAELLGWGDGSEGGLGEAT